MHQIQFMDVGWHFLSALHHHSPRRGAVVTLAVRRRPRNRRCSSRKSPAPQSISHPGAKNPVLRAAAHATHLISPKTAGLALRYGIFIRVDGWDDRRLVCHKLVHAMQYERLGGIPQFLEQYLFECLTIGFPAAPMEQEAIITTARLCG